METEELIFFDESLKDIPIMLGSEEIASLIGKKHHNILQDCDELNECYKEFGLPKIRETTYKDSQNCEQREYYLTYMQCSNLMFRYNRKLRSKVNHHWKELKKEVEAVE